MKHNTSAPREQEQVFICPKTGKPVTPVAVVPKDTGLWWECNNPIHRYNGKRENDWHMIGKKTSHET